MPHGAGHRITSDPQLPAAALFDIPVERISEHYEVMRHGGGDASWLQSTLRFITLEAGALHPARAPALRISRANA